MRPARDLTDVAAWAEDRVPSDVEKVMIFVYHYRKLIGVGPAWAEIIDVMGWQHIPREDWRRKFKRMRRWGLRWEINKSNSTSISRAALPYVKAKAHSTTVVSEC